MSISDGVFPCLGVGPLTKASGMLLEFGQVAQGRRLAFLAFLWGLLPPLSTVLANKYLQH